MLGARKSSLQKEPSGSAGKGDGSYEGIADSGESFVGNVLKELGRKAQVVWEAIFSDHSLPWNWGDEISFAALVWQFEQRVARGDEEPIEKAFADLYWAGYPPAFKIVEDGEVDVLLGKWAIWVPPNQEDSNRDEIVGGWAHDCGVVYTYDHRAEAAADARGGVISTEGVRWIVRRFDGSPERTDA